MTKARHLPCLALLLLAACSQDATDVDVGVASVTVSPSPATVEVGLSIQFTAEAFDASGNAISGQVVGWETSDPSIASVDGDGLATGLQVGNAEITAEIGGVRASQSLDVAPSACASFTDVLLSPGQFASFAGDECLLLPAGSPGDLYRVAIARPTLIENPSNDALVTLSVSPVLAAVEPPAEGPSPVGPAPLPSAFAYGLMDTGRALEHLRWQSATRAFHNRLRIGERSLGLARDGFLASADRPSGAAPALIDPPASDFLYLRPDPAVCATDTKELVTLVGFSDRIAIYQEADAYDTLEISASAADEMIAFYDSYVHDMVVDYWGAIPDVNGDGRVTVVTTPHLGDNVAAAVFSADFAQDGTICRSNERETVYFQGELIRLLDPPAADPEYFGLGVLAHEMKHVVSLYNSIERGDLIGAPPSFNELWIEEGTAEVSQSMASRIAWAANGGPALGAPITAQDILTTVFANGGRATKEISGLIDNLAGMVWSLGGQPNSIITDSNGVPDAHSFYSTSWLWHRFLGDGFGDAPGGNESDFFRALTAPGTPAGGAAGEIQLTGVADFYELFEDFVVAVSLHGSGFTAPHPIDTWDFVSSGSIFSEPNPDGDFPWPVTATEETDPLGRPVVTQWAPFESASYTGLIGPSGVRFHDFRSSGGPAVQVRVSGSEQSCDTSAARCDRIIVTRLD